MDDETQTELYAIIDILYQFANLRLTSRGVIAVVLMLQQEILLLQLPVWIDRHSVNCLINCVGALQFAEGIRLMPGIF